MRRDLVLLSGGLDSAVALAMCVERCSAGMALSIDYGQRHDRELLAARGIAKHYGVPHHEIELADWGKLVGPLSTVISGDGPLAGKPTVVPNRNAVFISVAASVALTQRRGRVVIAAHEGDHAVYPDCRPDFLDAADEMLRLATEGAVRLYAPFAASSHARVVRVGQQLGVPFEHTWSCYAGGRSHCGTCGACTERRAAFTAAGVDDPTAYLEAACF